jgi:GDPmannose 4,6-dehydratase
MQHNEPEDFVLASGETHSVEEFLGQAFLAAGIENWKPLVSQNPEFMRPAEVDILLGDPTKAEQVLGWKRDVDFVGLVKLMVEHDLADQKRLNR